MGRVFHTALLVTLLASAFTFTVGEIDERFTQITSKNWNQVVGKDNHVLVEFMSPQCGRCKAFQSTHYVSMLDAYEGTGLVLAQADVLNDRSIMNKGLHEDSNKTSWPMIKLYTAGSQRPILYRGPLHRTKLAAFIQENTGLQAKDTASDEL